MIFDVIENEMLRRLVMASESIASLPAADMEAMVKRIAALPVDGQMALMQTLQQEQEAIAAAKAAKGITPEMEAKLLEENVKQLTGVKREFEKAVRTEQEHEDAINSDKAADDLLQQMNS